MRPATAIVLAATLLAARHAALATRAAPTVRGTVQTADGSKVLGATVWLVGGTPGDSTIAATTDAAGAFHFSLPLGAASELLVRRRGFADARVPLGAGAASKRNVELPPVTMTLRAAPLTTAVVPDTGVYTGYAAGFFRRLAARRVDVITRGDISRMKAPRTTTALRMLPGVAVETGAGGVGYIRLRGRPCYASLYLDGTSLGSGRTFDLDAIPLSTVLGVEVFAFPTSLPIEYQSRESTACGVVALWTKRDDELGDDVLEPASVAEPSSVRLASEVETPARLPDSAVFAPRYPAAARAEGVGGTAVIEMVVDSSGAVERGSLGVAAAATPEIGAAAVHAASKLRFVPARANGRPVRQLVQLAADFRPARR